MAETYIVLFRGINVGGRVAKMDTLRKALEDAGFGGVKTYIQSGNVVLTSDLKTEAAGELVGRTFTAAFGYSSRPSLRSLAQWQRVIDENPFAYKNIRDVMAAQADLVETLAEFNPRIVRMAPEGEKPED